MTPLEDAVAAVRTLGRGTLLDPAGCIGRQLASLPALTTLRAVLAWTTIVPVQLGPVREVGAAVLTVEMVHVRPQSQLTCRQSTPPHSSTSWPTSPEM